MKRSSPLLKIPELCALCASCGFHSWILYMSRNFANPDEFLLF